MFEESDDSDDFTRYGKYVLPAIYALALLFAFYAWLSIYGRLIGVIGSVVLTLAAFAIYQWARVWLNARRQERGPEDDGAPITLNLSSSAPRDKDDEWG
jgi:squalene cyclase